MDFVSTKQAPEAIGPYSQAVITGNLVFTAGQIALDPRSMEMVGDDLAAQTDRVLTNLAAVLSEAGCTFSDVVKTTVYLADMADFPIMNEVYARHFGNHRPARAAVQAAALPKGGLVEIDAVAVRS
jgi:2-iminobutanoate/2-iminopropanoate deaminase